MAIDFDLLFFTPQEIEAELETPYSLLSTVIPDARVIYEQTT